MATMKLGLIGCGPMGRSLATSAQELEHAEVVLVSDIDEDRAKGLANDLGAEYVTDYDALLDREEIDGVLIASPPFLHRPMVEAAASAGKHIFCEKPMAPYVADCDAMIDAIERAGVTFQIGHVCRFHATHSKVRELVASGAYGSPTTMLVHRIGSTWGREHPGWRLSRSKSGGTLMEVNAHEIDFMRYVCGDVARVSAVGGHFVDERQDYPDVALVSMQFASGAVGVLHSSHASAIGGYGGRVDLTEGSIVFPRIWGGDATIDIKRFDSDEIEKIRIADIEVESPVRAEIRAFVDAVQNGTEPPVTMWDGRAAVAVAEAAYESIAQGGVVISLDEGNRA